MLKSIILLVIALQFTLAQNEIITFLAGCPIELLDVELDAFLKTENLNNQHRSYVTIEELPKRHFAQRIVIPLSNFSKTYDFIENNLSKYLTELEEAGKSHALEKSGSKKTMQIIQRIIDKFNSNYGDELYDLHSLVKEIRTTKPKVIYSNDDREIMDRIVSIIDQINMRHEALMRQFKTLIQYQESKESKDTIKMKQSFCSYELKHGKLLDDIDTIIEMITTVIPIAEADETTAGMQKSLNEFSSKFDTMQQKLDYLLMRESKALDPTAIRELEAALNIFNRQSGSIFNELKLAIVVIRNTRWSLSNYAQVTAVGRIQTAVDDLNAKCNFIAEVLANVMLEQQHFDVNGEGYGYDEYDRNTKIPVTRDRQTDERDMLRAMKRTIDKLEEQISQTPIARMQATLERLESKQASIPLELSNILKVTLEAGKQFATHQSDESILEALNELNNKFENWSENSTKQEAFIMQRLSETINDFDLKHDALLSTSSHMLAVMSKEHATSLQMSILDFIAEHEELLEKLNGIATRMGKEQENKMIIFKECKDNAIEHYQNLIIDFLDTLNISVMANNSPDKISHQNTAKDMQKLIDQLGEQHELVLLQYANSLDNITSSEQHNAEHMILLKNAAQLLRILAKESGTVWQNKAMQRIQTSLDDFTIKLDGLICSKIVADNDAEHFYSFEVKQDILLEEIQQLAATTNNPAQFEFIQHMQETIEHYGDKQNKLLPQLTNTIRDLAREQESALKLREQTHMAALRHMQQTLDSSFGRKMYDDTCRKSEMQTIMNNFLTNQTVLWQEFVAKQDKAVTCKNSSNLLETLQSMQNAIYSFGESHAAQLNHISKTSEFLAADENRLRSLCTLQQLSNNTISTSYKTQPTSCSQATEQLHTSGIYKIYIDDSEETAFDVWCDLDITDGNWLVIQRRQDGSVDFVRDWQDYKAGFGNLAGEFWLGLEKLHKLTARTPQRLLIILEDFNGKRTYANYDAFAIGNEKESYALHALGNYTGDAGDSLRRHLGMKFTTKDVDNDEWMFGNCGKSSRGGWWYRSCHLSNLNGLYLNGNIKKEHQDQGIEWWTLRKRYSFKFVQMMIRPLKDE